MAPEIQEVHKTLDVIEKNIKEFTEKAVGEIKDLGKVSSDTKAALETLSLKQREQADEILTIKQAATAPGGEKKTTSWGQQFVKSASYAAFNGGGTQKARFEVKNTIVSADAVSPPDRRPGIVAGAYQPLTLEAFLPKVPTTAGSIEFTRENVFTNNAAETAEGVAKPQSSLTWTLVTQPVATVAHWIKISRQLAADAPALAAYIDNRMRYGVDLRVETQLATGDGVAPNIAGFMKSGNFTAHGYANAALGTVFKKMVMIRKIIADLYVAGFPPNAIVLNPQDWASIEIELFTTAAGQTMYSINETGTPMLFGLPVIQSIGMVADTVAVGNFAQACTIYDREGVTVDMSESDADNFTENLITIRAERRLALVVERPAAIRAGDLTPA